MAKKGMRRPDPSEPHGTESNKKNKHPKNDMPPVPEIQGKGKLGMCGSNECNIYHCVSFVSAM